MYVYAVPLKPLKLLPSMSNVLLSVTPETFQKEVLESKDPVLVDFWAPWCQPCKQLTPRVEKAAEENPDIKVVAVDCEAHREFAKELGLRSIPTLRLYVNGEVVEEAIGALAAQKLQSLVDRADEYV